MKTALLLLVSVAAGASDISCVAVPLLRDGTVWKVECPVEPGVVRHLVMPTQEQWKTLSTPPAKMDSTKAR